MVAQSLMRALHNTCSFTPIFHTKQNDSHMDYLGGLLRRLMCHAAAGAEASRGNAQHALAVAAKEVADAQLLPAHQQAPGGQRRQQPDPPCSFCMSGVEAQ